MILLIHKSAKISPISANILMIKSNILHLKKRVFTGCWKSLPLRGRWHGKAVTEGVLRIKSYKTCPFYSLSHRLRRRQLPTLSVASRHLPLTGGVSPLGGSLLTRLSETKFRAKFFLVLFLSRKRTPARRGPISDSGGFACGPPRPATSGGAGGAGPGWGAPGGRPPPR